MKARILSVLTGLGGSLILGQSAPGDFTRLTLQRIDNGGAADVTYRLYVNFDNPNDQLIAMAGTPVAPLLFHVTDGTLYQHPFGTDISPWQVLIKVDPDTAFDTFVSIGREKQNPPDDPDFTKLKPGFQFQEDALIGDSDAWFIIPTDPQGFPDKNGRVLAAQFSLIDGPQPGEPRVSGWVLVNWMSDGQPMESSYEYAAYCAADGNRDGTVDVIDLLGLLTSKGTSDPTYDIGPPGGDGIVNVVDLLALLAQWGPCP